MRATTILAAMMLAAAGAATAQTATAIADARRPAADVARDAARKPAAMLDFARIAPGKKVADFVPGQGYFTRLFAVAVKPGGSVVAIVPAASANLDAAAAATIAAIAADPTYGNVTVAVAPTGAKDLDVFWTAQNYHDLHNALDPAGVAGFNKAVLAALKPGGVYIVIDHAAVAGSGLTATETLHRIDPAAVRAEIVAAGFVFDGESKALANASDPRRAIVFDPAIRGKTDQFAYRFKKPG